MQQPFKHNISNWQDFAQYVRPEGCHLLHALSNFPNSVLVAGCQRSGTSMMSSILMNSDKFHNYHQKKGSELQGALILAGIKQLKPEGRCCFQVTYLNDCYNELFNHIEHNKIVWVLRNPYSVVYSMLYNWPSFALNNLYSTCNHQYMVHDTNTPHRNIAVNKLQKACLSYNSKADQLMELHNRVCLDNLYILDYDTLIHRKHHILQQLYDFIGHPYQDKYALNIHSKSISKSSQLSHEENKTIEELCTSYYKGCKSILNTIK